MTPNLRVTGYADLFYVYEAPGRWRFWDGSTPGLPPSFVGMEYPTKALLLADLHAFAESRGYERGGAA